MCRASVSSPRRVRHSCRPCRLQTLPGCWQARASVSSRPRIGAIDGLSLVETARLHQERAERVAGGLHPAPWLVVKQTVVDHDGPAQMVQPLLDAAGLEGQFAFHHRLADLQHIRRRVVEHQSSRREAWRAPPRPCRVPRPPRHGAPDWPAPPRGPDAWRRWCTCRDRDRRAGPCRGCPATCRSGSSHALSCPRSFRKVRAGSARRPPAASRSAGRTPPAPPPAGRGTSRHRLRNARCGCDRRCRNSWRRAAPRISGRSGRALRLRATTFW